MQQEQAGSKIAFFATAGINQIIYSPVSTISPPPSSTSRPWYSDPQEEVEVFSSHHYSWASLQKKAAWSSD